MKNEQKTSWEPVAKWYNKIVGDEGHYYHQNIVLPGVIRLLELDKKKDGSLLDLACGQGILATKLPPSLAYLGIDASPSLVKLAKKNDKNPKHGYLVGDLTKTLTLDKKYSHATILLALQNIETPSAVLANSRKHLVDGGKLIIVLNHPCFRIPRQSSWQIDEQKKLQFRRLERYMSPMSVPIQAHPSKGEQSAATVSFHHPLSDYFKWLKENQFVVESMEEWCSDKESQGKNAKMENRSRDEFPLFLTLIAKAV